MKYIKKPLVIDAFQFRIDNCPDWFMDKVSKNYIITTETECSIHTSNGWLLAQKGDYIIQDSEGVIDACRPDIFESSYKKIEDSKPKNDEEFIKLVKLRLNETVDSIIQFADAILNNEYVYTESELELAHHLRISIIFYKAREDDEISTTDAENKVEANEL